MGGGEFNNGLRNAARKELITLTGGDIVLMNELLVLIRKGGEDWFPACSFAGDKDRIRKFFSAVAGIITGGGTITGTMKERFTETAAYFGYSAEEAMGLLPHSTRFRILLET
mgnify:FL=1